MFTTSPSRNTHTDRMMASAFRGLQSAAFAVLVKQDREAFLPSWYATRSLADEVQVDDVTEDGNSMRFRWSTCRWSHRSQMLRRRLPRKPRCRRGHKRKRTERVRSEHHGLLPWSVEGGRTRQRTFGASVGTVLWGGHPPPTLRMYGRDVFCKSVDSIDNISKSNTAVKSSGMGCCPPRSFRIDLYLW